MEPADAVLRREKKRSLQQVSTRLYPKIVLQWILLDIEVRGTDRDTEFKAVRQYYEHFRGPEKEN